MTRDEIKKLKFIRGILYGARSNAHLSKSLLQLQVNLALKRIDELLEEMGHGHEKTAATTEH